MLVNRSSDSQQTYTSKWIKNFAEEGSFASAGGKENRSINLRGAKQNETF
jgi:hypothetical protein